MAATLKVSDEMEIRAGEPLSKLRMYRLYSSPCMGVPKIRHPVLGVPITIQRAQYGIMLEYTSNCIGIPNMSSF